MEVAPKRKQPGLLMLSSSVPRLARLPTAASELPSWRYAESKLAQLLHARALWARVGAGRDHGLAPAVTSHTVAEACRIDHIFNQVLNKFCKLYFLILYRV